MRTADLEADGFVRDAFVCTSDAFCLLQDLLPHLLKVIEAFAYSTKGTCPSLVSQRQGVDQHQLESEGCSSTWQMQKLSPVTSSRAGFHKLQNQRPSGADFRAPGQEVSANLQHT